MSTARCEPLTLPGLAWPIELRTHPRARRLRLSIDERRGLLRLTCPPRTSRRSALEWAAGQRDWIESQLARIAPNVMISPGATLPFESEPLALEWRAGQTRTVRREPGLLWCGGPREGFERRISAWLRAEAIRILSAETAEMATRAGVRVAGVGVGDAATRWGSCSASGRIRYSVRLMLLPPDVRRFVVAHEVAHRRHMDHGPSFHALEAELFGGPVTAARSALRRLGPGLKRIRLAA